MTEVREFNILLRKIKYDMEARQQFCCKYYNLLKTHVYSKYGKFNDWEDIVQDVINKLISTDWTNYPHVDSPVSWLYTIADNHAKDLFKRTNRICEFNENLYPDFNIEYIDIRSDIRDAMKHLKSDEQYILYNHYWLGKELYVIAGETGDSYTNVRAKISKARKLLKKFL